jgi:hypothetical protein
MIAQIIKSPKPGFVRIITEYRAGFVYELKEEIPFPHRQYNAEDRTWDISESYLPALMRILKEHFDTVQNLIIKEKVLPIKGNLFEEVFKVLQPEYCSVVYKALAQAVHPDHGGTNQMMKYLNEAYEKVKVTK